MKVHFIRHSKTYGNTLHRYIGRTDESLCEEGIKLLNSKSYPQADIVYVSPMKRCVETAEIIYKDRVYKVVNGLKECDFGEFENKNYIELQDNENYQKWIDSNGKLPFPEGEDIKDFKERCIKAFNEVIDDATHNKYKSISLVVHGGTIMSIMDRLSYPNKEYFNWQIKNGEVLSVSLKEEEWISLEKRLYYLER